MRFQPVNCNTMQITRKRIKKINTSYSLEGMVLDNVEKIKYFGVTITNDLKWNTHVNNICTRLTGPLASLDETWRHVHETLKSQLTKDWYVQSLSKVVQFGTPKLYFFKMNLRRFRKEQLDL